MSTTTPHAQAVIDYLAGLLRTITRQAGYRTDLGRNVWDDEPDFAADGSVALGAARTVLLDLATSARGQHEYTLTLTIAGQVYHDPQRQPKPRAIARAWMADIQEALGAADLMDYPAGIEAIRFAGAEIPAREPEDNYLLPSLEYSIDYSNRAAL